MEDIRVFWEVFLHHSLLLPPARTKCESEGLWTSRTPHLRKPTFAGQFYLRFKCEFGVISPFQASLTLSLDWPHSQQPPKPQSDKLCLGRGHRSPRVRNWPVKPSPQPVQNDNAISMLSYTHKHNCTFSVSASLPLYVKILISLFEIFFSVQQFWSSLWACTTV